MIGKLEGATIPDNQIDFTGITLDAGTGRIMFPYLEPFGKRIDEILGNSVSDSVRQSLTFRELYELKQSDARISLRTVIIPYLVILKEAFQAFLSLAS